MILQLDSSYRDYNEYPYNSEFQITINGTPPNSQKDDVRSTRLVENYIEHAFSWIGNTSFNNPLSKVKNDTYETEVIPIARNKCIVLPTDENIAKKFDTINYFVGLLCYNSVTNLSATIINYNKEYFVLTLSRPIFLNFYENLLYNDCKNNIKDFENHTQKISIVNTSFHEKNNINLLGVTEIDFQPTEKFVLNKGVCRNMIVENVTKNWKSEIIYIRGTFRHVVLKNIPSYDSSDFFIVYKKPSLKQFVSTQKSFQNGLLDFSIVRSPEHVKVGDVFSDGNITVQIKNIYPSVKASIVNPGNFLKNQNVYTLHKDDLSLEIFSKSLGNGFISDNDLSSYSFDSIVAVVNQSRNSIQYYTIQKIVHRIVYINYRTYDLEEINNTFPIYFYFIPYRKIFPNVIIPTIPPNNLVCVEIQLISLTLPNLPICGYNITLADIPYVLVNFCNAQGKGQETVGTIFSNNPHAVNHNFVCPIANVRNRRLNFVVVSCKQKAIFKFSPRDSLTFRVSLPNGEKLSFVSNQYQKMLSCPPLNIPLNQNRNINEQKVFPYIPNYGISAVFEMKFL